MAQLLSCPKGHRWDAPGEKLEEAPAASTVCPVCGAASETKADGKTLMDDLPPLPIAGGPTLVASTPYRIDSTASNRPRVPGYEILEMIGEGGMGVVYRARQTALNRVVALKMIRAGAHAGTREFSRFQSEAEAVARLQHPNIVQIHEVGVADGQPFFSLEYIEGGNLADRLQAGPLPPTQAARLVETLARAVHYAHQRGIVHRDLKPANVLLSGIRNQESGVRGQRSGTRNQGAESQVTSLTPDSCLLSPKLTDFGLAKRVDEDSAQTKTGTILGTPSYMAPEQAAGKAKEVGPAADTYALGAILYETLTGRPPFRAASAIETVQQVLHDDPVAVTRLQPGTPRDLETICLKCLKKEPGQRYETAEALAEDLRRFQEGEPILARPTGVAVRFVKWCKRRPAVAALIGFVCLATIAGGIFAYRYFRDLEDANAEIGRYAGGLELANEQLERERDEVKTQRDKAQANLRKAFAVVNQFLTRVGEVRFATHYMEEERRKLLEEALTFCEQFLAENEKDPFARHETALANHRKASICRLLGKDEEVEKALGRAIELAAKLLEDFPEQDEVRFDLAMMRHDLGEQFRDKDQREEAEKEYTATLELLRPLLAKQPENADYRNAQAAVLSNRATQLATKGDTKRAEETFHQTAAVYEALTKAFPAEPMYKHNWATCLMKLARMEDLNDKTEAAGKTMERGVALFLDLNREHKNVGEYQSALSRAYGQLGLFYLQNDRVRLAEPYLKKSVEIRDALAKLYPKVPGVQFDCAESWNVLGKLYLDTDRLQPAADAFSEAIKLWERLLKDHGRLAAYQIGLAGSCLNIGLVFNRDRQGKTAVEWYDKGVKLMEELLAEKKETAEAKKLLVDLLKSRVFALTQMGQNETALPDLDRLIELTEGDDRTFQRVVRIRVLARLKRFDKALEEAEALMAGRSPPPSALYDLACVFALAAEAEKDEAKAEQLAVRAVALLQEAYAAKQLDTTARKLQLQNDGDLRILRNREDFKKLVKRVIEKD